MSGKPVPKIKDSSDLRDMLLEELDRIRMGDIDSRRTNALCRVSENVVKLMRLELDVGRELRKTRSGAVIMGRPVQMKKLAKREAEDAEIIDG